MGQLLSEALPLAVAGGTLGVLVAACLLKLVPALVPNLPGNALVLDSRVLLFTAAISLLTALFFWTPSGILGFEI